MEEYIKEFSGKIIGIIETDAKGDKTARTFPGREILGFYIKQYNYTLEYPSRLIIAKGDALVSLIYKNLENKK